MEQTDYRVSPHVDFKLRPLSEAVTTRLATEGFLVRVGAQVLQKVTLERTLAHGTLERFHAAVIASQVFPQSVASGKRLHRRI
jgi:hypothetical protein